MKLKNFIKFISVLIIISLLSGSLYGCSLFLDYQSDYAMYESEYFSDYKYVRPDIDKFKYEISYIEENCNKVYKFLKINDAFNTAYDIVINFYAMRGLLELFSMQDITNDYYSNEAQYVEENIEYVNDELNRIAGILKKSKTAFIIEFYNGRDVWTLFDDYKEKTPNEKLLVTLKLKENELIDKYYDVAAFDYRVDMSAIPEAKAYEKDFMLNENELYNLYLNEVIDYETFLFYYRELKAEANKALADVYIEMMALRKRIGNAAGADSYMEYAYKDLYSRSYSIEEVSKLRDYVREIIVPLNNKVKVALDEEMLLTIDSYIGELYNNDLDANVKTVLNKIDKDMTKSYSWMREHGFSDFEDSNIKADVGFTTYLTIFERPYIMINPIGYSTYDFFTVFHEFGHYFAYETGGLTEVNANDLDSAEVFSQSLEMLACLNLNEFFKNSDDINMLFLSRLSSLLDSIINGCVYDEFQERAYMLQDPDVNKLNMLCGEIFNKYGIDYYNVGDNEALSWSQNTHNFIVPFYYISYSTSAIAALEVVFSENPVSIYETLLAGYSELSFIDLLDSALIKSPFNKDVFDEINSNISKYL